MKYVHQPQERNVFVIPFIMTLAFAVIELLGGIWAHSLALLSDAWHMFSDVFALGLAMMAAQKVNKAKMQKRQSHAELIASSINALLMLAVTVWIVIEAIERLNHPRPVAGFYVMAIALIGLIVNLVVAKQLHQGGGAKGLNHQAALLHVVGDILGSVAALVAGIVIYLTGWLPIDAILSVFISLLLLAGTANLIRNIWLSLNGKEAKRHHHHRHHH